MGWIYHRLGREAERGNNLLMDEIHAPGGGVPRRMAPLVLIGTLLTHLCGGSAGREGTAVQMGGSLAAAYAKLFHVTRANLRVLLMAGVAAVLYLLQVGSVRFNSGFLLGVKAFTAAVLGGIGNLRGALLGGLLLGVAENWGSAVFGTEWKDVVAFVLLVLILLFRPTGLLGESLGKARA